MNVKEMRALSVEELKTKMADVSEELMKLRFQVVSGQLRDTSRLPILRKEIARMQTVLHQQAEQIAQEGDK